MAASTTLLQFLLMLVPGWLQRQQAATIDYLKAENRMLRERLGGRRLVFTMPSAASLARRRGCSGAKRCASLARSSRRIRCFVGTGSWWRANGPSLNDAVLVDLASARNWWPWWCACRITTADALTWVLGQAHRIRLRRPQGQTSSEGGIDWMPVLACESNRYSVGSTMSYDWVPACV